MSGKLVYGVGINDANYITQKFEPISYSEDGKRIQKRIWTCPFYTKWTDMLKRCYSETYQIKQPSYIGCITVPEWYYFMTFRGWMMEQDWKGNSLDKDLLVKGNKVYGPDTCVFVSHLVNNFLLERKAVNNDQLIGAHFDKQMKKYRASCSSITTGKSKFIGLYETPEEAHQAYREYKYQQAILLASVQTDPRVAQALLDRYKP